MPKLILASNSARRQQLLRDAGFDFEVIVRDVDESYASTVPAIEVAEHLAKKKNTEYRAFLTQGVVVTADTVVIANEEILGKPVDKEDAFRMIKQMVGQTHEVVSGVAISSPDRLINFSDVVEVDLNELSDHEINFYIDHYKPYDKAGAYGIQEWIGMIGVSKIRGSFYSVMGLPIHSVYQSLKNDFGVSPFED